MILSDDEAGRPADPPGHLEERGQAQYGARELQQIRDEFTSGRTPLCPRCNAVMTRREIGGGSFGLGYARQRDWLICGKCRRSAIFDIQRGTRT
jgi:ribosomal protein S27AE